MATKDPESCSTSQNLDQLDGGPIWIMAKSNLSKTIGRLLRRCMKVDAGVRQMVVCGLQIIHCKSNVGWAY